MLPFFIFLQERSWHTCWINFKSLIIPFFCEIFNCYEFCLANNNFLFIQISPKQIKILDNQISNGPIIPTESLYWGFSFFFFLLTYFLFFVTTIMVLINIIISILFLGLGSIIIVSSQLKLNLPNKKEWREHFYFIFHFSFFIFF